MTPEAQRIAIAEACGWIRATDGSDFFWDGRSPTSVYLHQIPDYLNDLNAMHEAEKVLDANQRVAFGCHLARLGETYECIPGSERLYVNWGATHATATQRAEAFLRTLNLWKD